MMETTEQRATRKTRVSHPHPVRRQAQPKPHAYRWTRQEYHKLIETGVLEGKRVELIDGEIIAMAPMLDGHMLSVNKTARAFYRLLGDKPAVCVQSPLVLGAHEPEPDVAVVPGVLEDYVKKPTTALLVVEISDSTLRYDRTQKASLYASASVPEYWILNLRERQLEVLRDPQPEAKARFGFAYRSVSVFKASEFVSCGFDATKTIAVTDLLP